MCFANARENKGILCDKMALNHKNVNARHANTFPYGVFTLVEQTKDMNKIERIL